MTTACPTDTNAVKASLILDMARRAAEPGVGITFLSANPRLDILVLDRAFYLFPRLVDRDDVTVADMRLQAGVATVPGNAVGAPGHPRLSFATDTATLKEVCSWSVTASGHRA